MAEKAVAPGDLEQQIIARALKDPQFRAQLISNPREALASMGIQLPADVQVRVIEQEPNVLYLVLPERAEIIEAAGELSEAELAEVAGGDICSMAIMPGA